jgi:hypothetical protein
MDGERIGDFLVRIGAMTELQVSEVLEAQRSSDGALFGWLAIERGFIDDAALKCYIDRPEHSAVSGP